jgi:phenylalanyl-tRNA synthetase beta chain
VRIKDNDLCKRYVGAVMTNVEIKESPSWMKDRLKSSGIKSINNVVDATNYIMLELGNPLHAFDFEQIKDGAKANIVVRRAKDNEKIILLDDAELKLTKNDLLITNGETPLALAGIMGGKNSGINENTKMIVLEAASFAPTNIRRSRIRLNVRSESSDKFEKDLDPNLAEKAMVRLIEILEHTANAKLEGVVDVYPKKVLPWKIKLDLSYVNNLLGEKIPEKDVMQILSSLGVQIKKGKLLECSVPTYRIDLKTQEDLIEEIGRIWGYENVKPQPIIEANAPAVINEQAFFERKIQDVLVGLGYDEVYNYSFYSKADVEKCKLSNIKHLELANPMSPEQELVRVSLIPNILKNIRENLKHFKEFGIFEEAKIYSPEEKRMLVVAKVLENDKEAEAFFQLKGSVEDLLNTLKIKNYSFEEARADTFWQEGRYAEIKAGRDIIGKIGEIKSQALDGYKIKNRVGVAEFDLEILRKLSDKITIYSSLNKFPSVFRDVSMMDKNGVTAAQIICEITKTGGSLIQNVELFDIFQRDNEKSLAFHIEFNAGDRTLEGKEIDEVMEKITSNLEKGLGVEIRK